MGKMSRPTLWLLVFACASPLIALDPHQPIRQLYHTVWTARDGLTGFASLSIADSILEGKSKFLAEVERVRQTLESARDTAVLFLIDKILSGTNSRDRRIASESIIRALLEFGAIGVLSTHDLTLTEIAELEGLAGSNVHMGSRSGEVPMDFDYLLKPGMTTETNALAIAEMMGVPIVNCPR
jgi:DNA mismatch repair ATPase MutS